MQGSTKGERRARRAIGIGIAGVVVTASAVAAAPWKLQSTDKLTDLATAVASPMDGGQAHLTAEATDDGGTRVRLVVTGFELDAVGTTFGAHVHVGPCREGNGAAALGHYNHGDVSQPITANEVWLDLTVEAGGRAESVADVDFAIPPGGARSVVIHAIPTASDGSAGARLACLPAEF